MCRLLLYLYFVRYFVSNIQHTYEYGRKSEISQSIEQYENMTTKLYFRGVGVPGHRTNDENELLH